MISGRMGAFANGKGGAQVREALLSGALRRVLVPFEPPPVPVHLVYLGGSQTPARVRALVAFAAERLRGNPVLEE